MKRTIQIVLANLLQNCDMQDAARLRDEIKALQPCCSSDTLTNGVRITASSSFERVQSGPDLTQYLYVYT